MKIRFFAQVLPLVLTLAGISIAIDSDAQGYQGAAAVLQRAAEQTNAAPKKVSASAKLKQDIKAFQKKLPGLTPEKMAEGWLLLLDRFGKLDYSTLYTEGSRNHPTYQDLFGVLPPPKAWSDLLQQVESRPPLKGSQATRDVVLKLFVDTLNNLPEEQKQDLAELEKLVIAGSESNPRDLVNILVELDKALLDSTDDIQAVEKILERQLKQAERSEYDQEIRIPDLVSLLGKEKAEAFLRRALVKEVEVNVYHGEDTKALARELALELITELKKPQWSLAESLDAISLYEAMEKKFAKPEAATNSIEDLISFANSDSDFEKKEARTYYLLGLIINDRTDDAVAVAQKLAKDDWFYLPDDATKALDRAGHTKALHGFFKRLLTASPELPFWEAYIQLAAKAGETDSMLDVARAAAANEDISSRKRSSIKNRLSLALLAADRIEEGVAQLQQRIGDAAEDAGSGALQLARLGALLNKPEWLEAGIKQVKAQAETGTGNDILYVLPEMIDLLQGLGRGLEAEAILADFLTRKASASPHSGWAMNNQQTVLKALARVYHKEGFHKDVIILLDEAEGWGVNDLKGIESIGFNPYGAKEKDPLLYVAAVALSETGRKEEARKLLYALLQAKPGFDPAYELLLKWDGGTALPKLEALFALDQFEERPLIWKAVLLHRAGKLDEAESVIRKAIAIDPSDGEQGPGDRLRAYAVLADIREARGDQKQAEFLRGAVKAIRLSEKADKFYEAGLLKRAVQMYEESLTHFSDAYCIQSRLALRMAELGQHEKAEEHYRRAYELMPDSFGRVESHCFGCEQAFSGQRAQAIAEKVFTDLVRTTPEKPQVHYLLGYLRDEQGRTLEALKHFQEAVRLDPEYLNAWKKIAEIGDQLRLPAAERDAVALNLFRLDPLGRHGGVDYENVSDLRKLWEAVESAMKLQPKTPDTLYVLTASKAELEKTRNSEVGLWSDSDQEKRITPAGAILRNSVIRAIASFLAQPVEN